MTTAEDIAHLKCHYTPDGHFIPGCYGGMHGDCTCHNLTAHVERLGRRLGAARRRCEAMEARIADLRQENRTLRAALRMGRRLVNRGRPRSRRARLLGWLREADDGDR
jgi:hypothetical protein